MSEKEFENFEKIGSAYLRAKRQGIEFDFKNPEKSMREMNIEEARACRKSLRSSEDDKDRVEKFLSDLNSYRINTLNQIRMLRKRVNEVLDKREKKLRRDPDLMTVMQININDSDITNTPENRKADEAKKANEKKANKEKEKKEEKPKAPNKTGNADKKKGFSNLFG